MILLWLNVHKSIGRTEARDLYKMWVRHSQVRSRSRVNDEHRNFLEPISSTLRYYNRSSQPSRPSPWQPTALRFAMKWTSDRTVRVLWKDRLYSPGGHTWGKRPTAARWWPRWCPRTCTRPLNRSASRPNECSNKKDVKSLKVPALRLRLQQEQIDHSRNFTKEY